MSLKPAALSLFLLAATAAFAAPSEPLLIENVGPDEAQALFASADRVVWDRAARRAVVQFSDGAPSPLAVRDARPLGQASFEEAVQAALPDVEAFRERSPEAALRFAVKEPAFLQKPAPWVRRERPEAKALPSPQATCLFEGFETLPIWYENGGDWWHYQGGQPYNAVGDYYWMDADCDAFGGSWSADAILGGDIGLTLPCNADYADNTDSWLEYAPYITCAAGAAGAELSFYGKILSETGYDFFYYLASVDGVNYYGYSLSGNFADTWYAFSQDLTRWSGLGDLTAQPRFALAFAFQSDSVTPAGFHGFGARLDSIALSTVPLAVTSVSKAGSPFRLFVYGAGFAPGAWVYLDGVAVPRVVFKGQGLLVAKGGTALKAMVPRGRPVCVTVVNPGGATSACYTFTR